MKGWASFAALFSFLCLQAVAKLVNVTVDDNDDSILYDPRQAWVAGQENCERCLAKGLDSLQTYAGTWHEGKSVRCLPPVRR